tara:strand:+ start:1867 stop:2220 length:354 start_codon:yes stop_codon:yes gene_type:complete
MAIKKHRKRTEALPHKRKEKASDHLKHKGSSFNTNVYWNKSRNVRQMSESERREHKYGGLKPKVKDARDKAKNYGTKYSPGEKRKSNFSRKVVKKAGGGKVGDSIKTYASGGYVEGK